MNRREAIKTVAVGGACIAMGGITAFGSEEEKSKDLIWKFNGCFDTKGTSTFADFELHSWDWKKVKIPISDKYPISDKHLDMLPFSANLSNCSIKMNGPTREVTLIWGDSEPTVMILDEESYFKLMDVVFKVAKKKLKLNVELKQIVSDDINHSFYFNLENV